MKVIGDTLYLDCMPSIISTLSSFQKLSLLLLLAAYLTATDDIRVLR